MIQNTVNIADFVINSKVEDTESLTKFLNELLNSPYRDHQPWSTLQRLNEMSQSHGVETVEDSQIAEAIYDSVKQVTQGNAIAYYLNTGDTYSLTVLYDCIREQYFIGTMGDFVEFSNKIKYVATEFEAYVPHIDWSEWQEDDGSYFPIRLRVFDGQLYACFGDPGWDNDHRGAVASEFLMPDMQASDYIETVVSMIREINNQ